MSYKYPFVEITKRRPSIYGPFTVFRVKKNGCPFLTTEKSTWWDINGFMILTKKRRITVIFKRRELTP